VIFLTIGAGYQPPGASRVVLADLAGGEFCLKG
jgi:hypothetical protein